MRAEHGVTPIPLPTVVDDPRWIGRFSREVRKSIAALRDRRVVFKGRQPSQGGGGGGGTPTGAFHRKFTKSDTHTYLQGGSVTGGNGGSATIADYKIIDESTGPVQDDEVVLYLQANCTATISDGIMLPGCLLNSAVLGTGAAVPSNHTFTVAADTGNIYVEVGRWTETGFTTSAAPGNYLASGCIGNFTLSKA